MSGTSVIKTTLTLEEFQERDNGWTLSRILDLTINVNRHNLMRAGCYVKLPRNIMTKKAMINVQSTDNACFDSDWCWSLCTLQKESRNGNHRICIIRRF